MDLRVEKEEDGEGEKEGAEKEIGREGGDEICARIGCFGLMFSSVDRYRLEERLAAFVCKGEEAPSLGDKLEAVEENGPEAIEEDGPEAIEEDGLEAAGLEDEVEDEAAAFDDAVAVERESFFGTDGAVGLVGEMGDEAGFFDG